MKLKILRKTGNFLRLMSFIKLKRKLLFVRKEMLAMKRVKRKQKNEYDKRFASVAKWYGNRLLTCIPRVRISPGASVPMV